MKPRLNTSQTFCRIRNVNEHLMFSASYNFKEQFMCINLNSSPKLKFFNSFRKLIKMADNGITLDNPERAIRMKEEWIFYLL